MASIAANAALRTPRSLRVIALPLTRAPHQLTYYHFVNPPSTVSKNANSLVNRAISKALDVWAGFGKAEERSWKRRAYVYGERIADRLDFEELALRSLDPSLGPKLSSIIPRPGNSPIPDTQAHIPLLYPSSALQDPLSHLHTLLASRAPRHRKGFYTWLAVTPLTFPLKLIPIIPNFPFFFCAWRVWSHYRAYKASDYLDALLKRGAIQPSASPQLDAVYAKYRPPPTRLDGGHPSSPSPSASSSPPSTPSSSPSASPSAAPSASASSSASAPPSSSELLLTRDAVPALQEALARELESAEESEGFAVGMYRALEQARARVEKRERGNGAGA